jgi:hypothetical protein
MSAGVSLETASCLRQQDHKMTVHWRCLSYLLAAFVLLGSLTPALADSCNTTATFSFCPNATAAAAALVGDPTQFTISNAVLRGVCDTATASTTYLGQLGVISDIGPCHYLKVGQQTLIVVALARSAAETVCNAPCTCRSTSVRQMHAAGVHNKCQRMLQ